jgi:hypothetical protein
MPSAPLLIVATRNSAAAVSRLSTACGSCQRTGESPEVGPVTDDSVLTRSFRVGGPGSSRRKLGRGRAAHATWSDDDVVGVCQSGLFRTQSPPLKCVD